MFTKIAHLKEFVSLQIDVHAELRVQAFAYKQQVGISDSNQKILDSFCTSMQHIYKQIDMRIRLIVRKERDKHIISNNLANRKKMLRQRNLFNQHDSNNKQIFNISILLYL